MIPRSTPQIVLEIIEAPIRLEMSDAIVNINTDNASFLYDDATAIVFDDGSKVELTQMKDLFPQSCVRSCVRP